MKFPDFKTELEYLAKGFDFVIGVDEVGMGPLAGPVVSAACIIKADSIKKRRTKNVWYQRVRDSKTVQENERQELVQKILENSHHHAIGQASVQEIDRLNIHHASILSKKRAVEKVLESIKQENKIFKIMVIIDGKFVVNALGKDFEKFFIIEQVAVVKGDSKILSIASASIVAKVYRDSMLQTYHQKYPMYGFDKHKGYGTKLHKEMIRLHGPLSLHRKSFL